MLKGGGRKAFGIVLTQTLEILAMLVVIAGGGGGAQIVSYIIQKGGCERLTLSRVGRGMQKDLDLWFFTFYSSPPPPCN